MKVLAIRHFKTLFLILLFAVFFSWQTVLAEDEPLVISGDPVTSVNQVVEPVEAGAVYNFEPTVNYPPEELTFSTIPETLPPWLEFVDDDNDGIPSLRNVENRPNNDDVGKYNITIGVENGKFKYLYFEIEVIDVPDPFKIVGDPVKEAYEGTGYYFRAEVLNPNGNHSFSISGLPDWLQFDTGTGVLENKQDRPNNDDVGVYPNILVCATDTDNIPVCLDLFDIEVKNTNNAPAINKVPDPPVEVVQGADYSYETTVEDPDMKHGQEELTFETIIPGWMTFESSHDEENKNYKFTLKGTPGYNDVSENPPLIKITAKDKEGETDELSFQLEVKNANDPPTVEFIGQPAATVDQDAPWTATIEGKDPDFGLDADEKLTFSVEIKDEAGQTTTLTDDADPPADFWLKMESDDTGRKRVLSGTPLNGDVGKYNINITATDAKGLPVETPLAFDLEIKNINARPTIAFEDPQTPPPSSVDQGAEWTAIFVAQDEDIGLSIDPPEQLTFTVEIKDERGETTLQTLTNDAEPSEPDFWLTALTIDAVTDPNLVKGTLTGTPDNKGVGKYKIYFGVKDVNGDEPVSPLVFDLEVNNVNEAPTISFDPQPKATVDQDTEWTASIKASDTDLDVDPSENLTVTVEIRDVADTEVLQTLTDGQDPTHDFWLNSLVKTSDTVRILSGTPKNDDVASYKIHIKVKDIEGPDYVEASVFDLEVLDINDPPSFTENNNPETVINEDDSGAERYKFVPEVQDIDVNEVLTYSIINKPKWLDFDEATGTLTNKTDRPDNSDVGLYEDIKIIVRDKENQVDEHVFNIEVINTNDAPTIEGTPEVAVDQNSEYKFKPTVSDDDLIHGDELTFSITGQQPDWTTFDTKTGELIGTPGQAHIGPTSAINICVKDRVTDFRCLDDSFVIQVADVNDPPTISGTPPTSVKFGDAYDFTPVYGDVDPTDADKLILVVENLPPWATFDYDTGRLYGTPTDPAHVGVNENVTIRVRDEESYADPPLIFNITVFTPMVGDINCDGIIDLSDAIAGLQILAGMMPAEVCLGGDADSNGNIGIADILYTLRRVLFSYTDVSPADAKVIIESNPDLVIIDVSPMYNDGHIPNAVNYPLGDGTLDNEIPNLDKNGKYLVYCHTDDASKQAAQKLLNAEIETVYRLEGNFGAWADVGYIDIPAAGAKKLIDENPDLILIIDVASSEMYDQEHIPNALPYPLNDLDTAIPGLSKEKDYYLIYCRTDGSSVAGAQKLVEAGFKPVYRLKGNLQAWKDAQYETDS